MLRLVPEGRPALEIAAESVVLGRDASADMLVDDRSVSRRHARVAQAGGAWTVEDLGSGNGTWIDGQRVATAPLANGQELRLGTLAFRVEIEGAAPAATMLVPALASVPPSRATMPGPPPLPGAPPPQPPAAGTDPYGSTPYAQPQQGYAPQPYAQPAATHAPADPYARSSTGGNGIWKILGFVVVAYVAYEHFGIGKKETVQQPPPAQQQPAGGAGQQGAPPAQQGAVKISGIEVQKSRSEDGGTQALVRTSVEGFKLREVDGGTQISLARDVEVALPDGTRIEQLSTTGQVLEQMIEPTNSVTLDYTLTVKPGVKATVVFKTRVVDQVGGGAATGQQRIDFP